MVIFFLFLLVIFSSQYALSEDANDVGASISNSLKDYYMKDRNTMNDKLFAPGNDGSKDLITIDGSSGKASFNCTSEFPFAQITYYPVGEGDINLVIEEDLDLDGVFEYSTSLNGVSAICTTGVLQCDSGTTKNCKFVSFNVDNAGKIVFGSPQVYFLSSYPCYFINNSAGSISTKFPEGVSKILNDVSGLVSNLVSNVKDFVGVVSYKDYQNFRVKISGTKPSSCISANSDTLKRAKSYYSSKGTDDSALTSDVDAVKTGMGDDIPMDGLDSSNSMGVYEYASSSPSLEHEPLPEKKQCLIKREPYVSKIVYYSDGRCYYGESNPCRGALIQVDGNLFKCNWSRTSSNSCGPKWNINVCGKWETGWSIPDDEYEYININGTTIRYVSRGGDETESGRGTCQGNTLEGSSNCGEYSASDSFVSLVVSYNNLGGCNGYASGYLYTYILKMEEFSLSNSNSCPSDPSCKLEEEYVCDNNGENCVKTFSLGSYLNINLTPICYSLTTDLDTYFICADGKDITVRSKVYEKVLYSGEDGWFYIKRTYRCEKDVLDNNMPEKDFFDMAVQTRESVYSNSDRTDINFNDSTGEFTYKDFVSGNGQVRTGSIDTIQKECNKVCRVKVHASQEGDISASSGEAVPDLTGNSNVSAKDTMDYITIRNCNDNVCPYDPLKEELLADCFCMGTEENIDIETLSGIMTTYEAVKDIICSSSPP